MAAPTRTDGRNPGILRLLRSAFPGAEPGWVAGSAGTPMDRALDALDTTLDGLAVEAERLEGLLARAHTPGPLVAGFREEIVGTSLVFTGAALLPLDRRAVLADRYGFTWTSRVTAKTHALVLGTPPGSPAHLQRARARGLPVLQEDAFWARLGEAR